MSNYISHIYIFENGMVAVFDSNGQQVPELQGKIEDVEKRLCSAISEQGKLPFIDTQSKWRNE